MTLRSALGCSAAFHVVLLFAAPPAWFPQLPATQKFEVAYRPAPPVRVPPPPAIEKADRPKTPEAPVPVRNEPLSIPAPKEPERSPAPPPVSRPAQRRPAERISVSAPRPAVSSLPEKEFVFLDHKEQVRKHLKARLNYPSFLSDGTVRLRVVLGPDGVLKQAVVVEASDSRLAGIAIRDAQAASPYPKPPPKYNPRQLRYEFLVRYKPE